MNIASGTPVQRGLSLNDISPREYLKRVMEEKFNGYMCITIRNETGIEEGALVFHEGSIVSSDYEYYRYNTRYTAEEGLVRTLNALLASKGVIDSFSLSSYQVQLIMTLNEDCNLKESITSKSAIELPAAFSNAFEGSLKKSEIRPVQKSYDKEVLLKKYGLAKLAGPNVTRALLLESAEDEVKKVDKMMKKRAK